MIAVSDHALLRHLERVEGIDIEAMRADLELSFSRAHAAADELGLRNYAIRSRGVTYMVRGGTVTTVLPALAERSRYMALAARRPD
jgi:hypothetical protein